ncbi:hypothetical protein PHMEG_00016925 [Phytophthora megakarya]|uniref:Helitron helicase n=1 Tax=Phytophthora megakarya TaxID=4795 RepID=A0A225VXT2_9STRA|nr:hypothetical protein PHMEG_00016925 [Phytophthora megakarya]
MGNKLKINVMFNWMHLAALLYHFSEGTPIPEGWLTNINVVALDDPRCECPEYAKPSPGTGNDRIIVFYFHEVRDLNSETLDGIKDYVDFMRVNAKTWWAILHWLTITFLERDAADTDASHASRDLYDERRRDVKRHQAQYEALLNRLFAITGFPKTLLYEPGLWTLPVCACRWILSVRPLFAVESLTTLLNLTTWTRRILSALNGLRRTATMTFWP